jgi:hypothetical protein
MVVAGVLAAAYGVLAQTELPGGGIRVAGTIDAYYSVDLDGRGLGSNALRGFDDKTNHVELNMASLSVDYSGKPLGFHVDAGAGRAFDIMSSTEKGVPGMGFFEQAFVEVKPASWKGLQVDFGKFASSASAEVIETSNNWNYSRSLLFVWCTPFYHFGIRAAAPVGKSLNAGVQLVGGWNNIVTGATFRTVGLTGSWTPSSKLTWTNTYYGGPDETPSHGMRKLYDTVVTLPAGSKTSFYVNFDYLHERQRSGAGSAVYGVAAAARFRLSRKVSLSPRSEWLNDNGGLATATGQQVKEFTVTGTYAFPGGLSGWLEFRHDWSNQPLPNRNQQTTVWKGQPTVLVGVVAVIRAKK